MLLSMMRKQAKSWLIKFLIGIISLVFVFYFGYSFHSRKALKVAYVNGELISTAEYRKAYGELLDGLRRQYKNVWNDNLIRVFDLKNRALQGLIEQKLISSEAKRLGLEVTKGEIQQAIMAYPAFQVQGRFSMRRYQALLSNNRMKPEDFEAGMGLQLMEEKVKQFLFAFMEVTDREVLDHYTYANEEVNIRFIRFRPETYRPAIHPDAAAVKAFFEKHREQYRVPEKVKVAYLEIDPKDFRDRVKIDERDMESYYEDHLSEFSEPRKVRARHILFKLAEDAGKKKEKTVLALAEKVLKAARSGEDFAALAEKYSEDAATRGKGGDLGYFGEGQMVKAFGDAAFNLKKGEISDLVRTRFGYHIIKVEDIRPAGTKSLKEVRDRVEDALLSAGSADLAQEKGLSLLDQMPYDADLAAYGAAHGFKVKYTGYFSEDAPIAGLGGDRNLRTSLFSLEKKESSDLIELNGRFYLFQVVDRQPSHLPKLKEVEAAVRDALVSELSVTRAKKDAEAYLAELRKGRPWDGLAKEKRMTPEETGFFSRRGPTPKMGNVPGLKDAVFRLNKDNPYPDRIFENDRGAFVVRWEGRKGIDRSKYEKEKEQYRVSLMQAKHQVAFRDWIEGLKKRACIEIVTPVDAVI